MIGVYVGESGVRTGLYDRVRPVPPRENVTVEPGRLGPEAVTVGENPRPAWRAAPEERAAH